MFYARLFIDPGCKRPSPPPGFEVKRCGVEFFRADGDVSYEGETCDDMLGRVAAGIRLMSFLYATDGTAWVSCHWTPNSDWTAGGHWSSWESCASPDTEGR